MMKLFKNLFLVALSVGVLSACNDDDSTPESTSRVKVALKTSTTTLKSTGTPSVEAFVLNEFKISIGEIEFDVNDDMENALPGNSPTYDDVELDGPFVVDLMDENADTGIDLAAANVPNATYEEIEFDLEPYEGDKDETMIGYSIMATGTYETAPFTIMSTEEIELEIEYPNGYKLDGTDSRLFIDLNLTTLKTLVADINFANAVAEDDGSIVISKDKNADILTAFEQAVENSFEVEEEDDDEDDE